MPSGKESRRASLARAFFEDNADALFLVDPDTGHIRDGNSMAMRLSGRTHAESNDSIALAIRSLVFTQPKVMPCAGLVMPRCFP
jgi:hypothetical protein